MFSHKNARAFLIAAQHDYVRGHHTAGDGCEAHRHDGHDLRARHGGNERFDGEWRLCLAKENIRGRGERFDAADIQHAANDPGQYCYHALHNSKVVQHRHE